MMTVKSHYGMNADSCGEGYYLKSRNQYKLIAIVLLGATLIIITGFRSANLSYDYREYEWIYKNTLRIKSFKDIIFGREPLFYLLLKIIGIFTNYEIVPVMVVIAFLTVIPLFWFIYKESISPVFVIYLLFTIGSYYTAFNTTRQYLAAALFVFAMEAAFERNLRKYILITLAITLVHFSALVMLPFYWLLNIRWADLKKSIRNMIIVVLIIFFFIAARNILNTLLNLYYFNVERTSATLYENETSLFNIFRPLVLLFIALLFKCDLNLDDPKDNCLFNSVVFFFLFYLYSYQVTLFVRFTYFFIPGSLVLMDKLLDRMKNTNRVIIFCALFVFSMLWSFAGLFNNEYQFFWE